MASADLDDLAAQASQQPPPMLQEAALVHRPRHARTQAREDRMPHAETGGHHVTGSSSRPPVSTPVFTASSSTSTARRMPGKRGMS